MMVSVWHCNEDREFQSLEGLQVLVVDNNVDSLELTSFILNDYKAKVIAVETASKALEAIAQFMPNILISEILLPDRDGYSLIHQIRTLPPQKGGLIPAIALTVCAKYQDRVLALESGFQTHIAKPLEPSELVAAVAKLARKSPSYAC